MSSEILYKAGPIDPDIPQTFIDVSSNYLIGGPNPIFKLSKARYDIYKSISLINPLSSVVTISLPKGSFTLSAAFTVAYLFYNRKLERWIIINENTPAVFATRQTVQITNNSADSSFGTSSALSANGKTLIIGSPGYGIDNIGKTYVYKLKNCHWKYEATLVGSNSIKPINNINQGIKVAISADASTIAIGGNGDNFNIGATWIFVKKHGEWIEEAKLVGTGVIGNFSEQGSGLSLSADGNTLAVGGPGDNNSIGATWIFKRKNGIWSQITKLVGTGYLGQPSQGDPVSLNSAGNILAVGGPLDNFNTGAIWIFNLVNDVWIQNTKLLGNLSNSYYLSAGLQLNSLGNILVAGTVITTNNTNFSAFYVFTQNNGVWTQFGNPLYPYSSFIELNNININVVINSVGNTIVLGSLCKINNILRVCAFIYTLNDNLWIPQIKPLVGCNDIVNNPNSFPELSLSINSLGDTIVLTSTKIPDSGGIAWIFN